MSQPRVSVVIPVWNGERYLAEALRSVMAQTFRSFEVLVIDDGSTDGSVAIARQFDVHPISQENAGTSAARNHGIELARGEFVAFLDQDDRWTPDKLAVQVRQLDDHKDWDGVSSRVRMWVDETAGPGVEHQPVCLLGAMLLRRSVFEQVGSFDPTDIWTSESEWFARVLNGGATIVMTPETLYEKRLHGARDTSPAPAPKRPPLARQRPAA